METWGYQIRLPEYQHFQSLNATDHLVFIGYPSAAHRETAAFCDTFPSELFANLYLPIWDGGANGTPVNDQNYFALYIFKTVSTYKNQVRFWEIWNEPDFTLNTAAAFAPPGAPGNWWENNPSPCDLATRAPVFHYVRLLRVAWEVIKTVDSTAYVCTGGIGNPAFLDAILRNTDNPADGSPTAEFPLGGGAYFDVLSFHSYPHLDGSMWEFPPGGGLFFHRHSDRGLEGMVKRRNDLAEVLENHGYDGSTYPKKLWTLSETNIPRKTFNVYIGSDEAQVNYLLKALVEAHRLDFKQLHIFNIADLSSEASAWNEFLLMGLFKNLSEFTYPNYELNDAAIAWKTAVDFFTGKKFDAPLTTALALPAEINGAAFTSQADTTFVLWVETSEDLSEAASATFAFPPAFGLDTLWQWAWNFSATQNTGQALASAVALTGTPFFFQRKPVEPVDTVVINAIAEEAGGFDFTCFPNPSQGDFSVRLKTEEPGKFTLKILNGQGQTIEILLEAMSVEASEQVLFFRKNLLPGLFWLEVMDENSRIILKPLVFK